MRALALAALLLLASPAWADHHLLNPPTGTITIKEWPTRGWSVVVIKTSGGVGGTDLVYLWDALGTIALVGPDSPDTGFDEAPALVTPDAADDHTAWWTVFTRVLVPRSNGGIVVTAQTDDGYQHSVSSTFWCRVTKAKNPRTTVCKP